MGLFKFPSKKSSPDVPRVTGKEILDKVSSLWGELADLDSELRDICDRQNKLHEKLDDLESIAVDLGVESGFPVYICPPQSN